MTGRRVSQAMIMAVVLGCYTTIQDFLQSETNATAGRQKIVYVTDAGIDDALGLLLILRSQQVVEILSVICTYGNTKVDNACSNVKRVLALSKEKQISIHRGSSGPLIKALDSDPSSFNGEDGLGNVAKEFPTGGLQVKDLSGVLALIEFTKKHPKEITVVSVGPLTTLALAHRVDPGFTENLKSIIFMGGNYKGIGNITPVAEFNFYIDPEAANIIVSESKCKMICIPWETSLKNGLRKEVYNKLLHIHTEKGYFFKKITAHSSDINFNNRGFGEHTVSDFLAAAFLLYPFSAQIQFQNPMTVEYQSSVTSGLVVLLRNSTERPNVTIVTDFDQQFIEHIMEKMLLE